MIPLKLCVGFFFFWWLLFLMYTLLLSPTCPCWRDKLYYTFEQNFFGITDTERVPYLVADLLTSGIKKYLDSPAS